MPNPRGNPNLHLYAPKGRPKGAQNRSTVEAAKFCREIVESKEYRESVVRRITKDTLDARIEQMLWDRGYGKVPEKINMTLNEETTVTERDLTTLTDEELAARAEALSREFVERRVPISDERPRTESDEDTTQNQSNDAHSVE